jgi:aryl-alcohol dehydrogenase-like predicted oxidoreductase
MRRDPHLSRREFVRATAVGAGLLLGNTLPAVGEDTGAKLPQRPLGKTGVQVSILGLGTVALGNLSDRKEAEALLNQAIDYGITYIDTAPGSTRLAPFTGYGRAQRYLNGVLKERRKEVFLVTKCLETDGDQAPDLLRKNLKELGVERVDLVHTHSIGHAMYNFDTLVGEKGPMAALETAKKDGLARFVGITGHNRPEKFAQVIARRNIDAMMNAVNIVDRHTYAFEAVVWPAARKKNVGLVAMKVFGGGITACKMPEDLRHASLRFALGVPGVAVAVIGMGTRKEVEQNLEWARTFKPLTAGEAKELKAKTVGLAKQWGAHLDRLDPKGEKSRPLVNT